MTARSSILAAHKGPDGQAVPRSGLGVEAAVHWLHGLAALGWVVAMAVVTGLALPRVRALLTIEARRWFDARLENVILASGVLTAILLVTGFYNLKRSTPYPTPYLSAEPDRVLDLPDAKPYFYTLAVKLTGYVLMLIAAALIIRRARALVEGLAPREPRIERAAGEHGSAAGATALLVESPPVDAKPANRFVAPVMFGGGAALVLFCVSLLTSLHIEIEGTPPPPPDPLTAEHVEGAAPAFTKVVVAGAGANAWDVTLTLADLHTQVPVSSVVVTVTGNGPDGAKVGPEDFTNLGEGRYRGRVSGPAGGWDLSAAAIDRRGEVPPTQQTFTVRLSQDSPASGSGS